MDTTSSRNPARDILLGTATGDALGVPVEFKSRAAISLSPVTDMIGYGTYNLPPGTWSDDSSLLFCLAETIGPDFTLQRVADNFVAWLYKNYWTPRGVVFDVGIATREAISRLAKGIQPELAGGFEVSSNGNGSLMRILPLLLLIKDKPIEERYELTKQVSSLTHAHIRSVIACFYYLEFARGLLAGNDPMVVYKTLKKEVSEFLKARNINPEEIALFSRLLQDDIFDLPAEEIRSSGYVIHTLEASIWCLLTTESYKEAVLKAVNLGEDTDTTGAVTGGLAGLLYGWETIPKQWLKQLARLEDIEALADQVSANLVN